MRTDDCYQVLGVSRYASRDALRRAFRLRLLAVHPDRNPGDCLAAERTRSVVEAYHVLSHPPDLPRCQAATLSTCEPRFAYRCAGAVALPSWTFRALTVLALMVLMAWFVLGFIRQVLGEQGPVFRPDLAALSNRDAVRAVPVVVEPDIHDCVEWYCTRQYEWSLAAGWAARDLVTAYDQAARRAATRKDFKQARFYRSAIETIVHSQRATFL